MSSIESLAAGRQNLAPTLNNAPTIQLGTMTLDWGGEGFKERMAEAFAIGLTDGAVIIAKQMKTNIGVQGPPRSLPGNFPHMDTQSLNNSISIDVATPAGLTAAAGVAREARNTETGALVDDYALGLEFGTRNTQPRPWALRTLIEQQRQVYMAVITGTAAALAPTGGGLRGVT